MKAALKKGVEDGTLVQVKNSYKLSAAAKKPAPKKKAAPKKKPAAKKTATKKKVRNIVPMLLRLLLVPPVSPVNCSYLFHVGST